MPQSLTPLDVLTSGGKYPEREQSDECTSSVRIKAADLAERVSKLCDFVGHVPAVSSGFRTSAVNAKVGGSSHSAHLTGEAVDLYDKDGSLARKVTGHFLAQFDLYAEDPAATGGWLHLTTRRPPSGSRIFKP